MRTQAKTTTARDPRQGRNTILGVYVILSTFFISAYTLVQYFSM
ncbi:hypothetical protein [Dokdonia donghaensis]|nr:hypothetical protein [Dokdonia donghaensis]ANH61476.1 hypothetical protein I597_2579 [Dokdonia donghaensis DSW-1]